MFIITFIVSAESLGGRRVFLVNENELTQTEKDFKLMSKKVYSINLENAIEDYMLIYASDFWRKH